MKTEGNQPASPSTTQSKRTDFDGLTKREYFASQAMASYFGGEFIGQSGMPYETIATNCVEMADALISALNSTL